LSNIDLSYKILNLDLEKSILKCYDNLNHSIDIFVPKVKLNLQYQHSITWSNPSLRNLINLKKQAHKKFRISNYQFDYIAFSDLRKKCKVLSTNVHSNYIFKIENNININLKSFWKYINTLRSNRNNTHSRYFMIILLGIT
jgi:hypothetical protein